MFPTQWTLLLASSASTATSPISIGATKSQSTAKITMSKVGNAQAVSPLIINLKVANALTPTALSPQQKRAHSAQLTLPTTQVRRLVNTRIPIARIWVRNNAFSAKLTSMSVLVVVA